MMHNALAHGIQRNILFHTRTNVLVLHISKAMPSCPEGVTSGSIAKDLIRNANARHETL